MFRFLFTHNPFYLLSACLVLYGMRLWTSEQPANSMIAWQLWLALFGYTTLLATTAILVVRGCRVWEDGRMLALLVILMLVAISSCFDEFFHSQMTTAAQLMAASGAFGVTIIEIMLLLLKVRLPLAYRLPLHSLILWFFAAPLLIQNDTLPFELLSQGARVLLFIVIASFIFMTLGFAIRLGSSIVENNGTPWRWPMYPWSIFFFLLIGVIIRSYAMTLSFQSAVGMESTFAPYYLAPLVLAIGFLFVEIGTVEKKPFCMTLGAAAPLIAITLASMGSYTYTQRALIYELSKTFASPIWLSVLAAILFYGYLTILKVPYARYAVMLGLIAISTMPISIMSWHQIEFGDARTLSIAAIVSMMIAWEKGRSEWAQLGIALILVVFARQMTLYELTSKWYVLASYVHAWLGLSMMVAWTYQDRSAQWCRSTAFPAIWFALCVTAALLIPLKSFDYRIIATYLLAMSLLATLIAMFSRIKNWIIAAIACFGAFSALIVGYTAWWIYSWNLSRVALYLIFGGASFAIGFLVSLMKSNSGRYVREMHEKLKLLLSKEFSKQSSSPLNNAIPAADVFD